MNWFVWFAGFGVGWGAAFVVVLIADSLKRRK